MKLKGATRAIILSNRLSKLAEEEKFTKKKRIFIPSAADFPQLEFTMGLVVSMGILQSAITVVSNPARKDPSESIAWYFILLAAFVAIGIVSCLIKLIMVLNEILTPKDGDNEAAVKWVETETFKSADGSMIKISDATTCDRINAAVLCKGPMHRALP